MDFADFRDVLENKKPNQLRGKSSGTLAGTMCS